MTENPLPVFHGWSDQATSFDRLASLLRERLDREVEEVFLVDWLSLDDEVTYADLHEYWYGTKQVKATVLVGNEGYGGVRAAANEPGGDGTVRVSTANLNVNKMEIDLASDQNVSVVTGHSSLVTCN